MDPMLQAIVYRDGDWILQNKKILKSCVLCEADIG